MIMKAIYDAYLHISTPVPGLPSNLHISQEPFTVTQYHIFLCATSPSCLSGNVLHIS